MAITFDLLSFFGVRPLMGQNFSPPASCVMMDLKVLCHFFCPLLRSCILLLNMWMLFILSFSLSVNRPEIAILGVCFRDKKLQSGALFSFF